MRNTVTLLVMVFLLAVLRQGQATPLFAQGSLGPDLRPHTPSGYEAPVIASSRQGTNTSDTLYAKATTFFDWYVINDGDQATSDSFYVDLWVDGLRYVHYPVSLVMDPGAIIPWEDWGENIPDAGCHDVQLVVDPDHTVAESDESNNTWQGQYCWNAITGWLGEYFANPGLDDSPWIVRDDASIDFEWYEYAPDPALPADLFSVRWTRTMSFSTGPYRFQVLHDDGARLFLDGDTIIDNWCTNCREEDQVDRWLTAGDHLLKLEMWENAGWAAASLNITTLPVYNLYLPYVSRGAVAGLSRSGSATAKYTPTPAPSTKSRLTAPTVRTPSAGPTATPTIRPAR